ncbi:hypothetical protein CMK11_07135 [Candidatus Poribacteria bacterium]|nr:hypothetical protein [Candidatus Poribacteria bacterium]
MPESTTKHILFTDIVAFATLDDAAQMAMVQALEQLITAALESEHASAESRILLPTGDGYALAFDELKVPVTIAGVVASAIRRTSTGKHIPATHQNPRGPGHSISMGVLDLWDSVDRFVDLIHRQN